MEAGIRGAGSSSDRYFIQLESAMARTSSAQQPHLLRISQKRRSSAERSESYSEIRTENTHTRVSG
jgi:hypothetical protein